MSVTAFFVDSEAGVILVIDAVLILIVVFVAIVTVGTVPVLFVFSVI